MSAAVARRYFLRAREQLRVGDVEAAGQAFGAAMELCPDFVEARVGHALTLAASDPPRAAALLRTGLRGAVRPGARRLLLCALGDVLLAGHDLPGAEAAFAEAATLPGTPLHGRLTRLRARTGDYHAAFAELLGAARHS